MEASTTTYYQRLMSAMIRGMLREQYPDHELFKKHLDDLLDEDYEVLSHLGEHHHLPISAFQRLPILPETLKIMDTIRGIAPDNLLDVGSGRGAFIWRLLDEYRTVPITSIDVKEERVKVLDAVSKGGIHNLIAKNADVTQLGFFPKGAFDVTTALKVLEYVEDIEQAIAEIFRVTKRFIIVQYSISDSNHPERQPSLSQEKLVELFRAHEPMQLKVETVSNYYILVIRK